MIMTPGRAWIAATVLATALLALAIGAATLLEPHTRGFDRFQGLAIWKIDAHQRIDPEVLGYAVNVAASQGILGIVNLGGGHAGGGLERHLEAAARFPGRVLVFMELDERGCCDADWADRETARLVTGRALGARGLHLPRRLVSRGGEPVALDAPSLAPVWQVVAGLAIPVAFDPGRGAEARERLLKLLEGQPGIPFVAFDMGGLGGNPAALGALLSRFPNLHVDTAGAIPEMARDPEATRQLLAAHSDRVLLGSDLAWLQGPRPEQRALVIGSGTPVRTREPLLRFFDSTWRFLESRDADIPGPVAGDAPVEGLALPREQLERILRDNARKLLGFGDLEAL
jgi:predicted TIM-barrel fold metal-dependent hydrolase